MTAANMLSRVRTRLDESTASFYTDAEIYAALADGQREIISLALSLYKAQAAINNEVELPEILFSLYAEDSGSLSTAGINSASLPTDNLYVIAIMYDVGTGTGGEKPCIIRRSQKQNQFLRANTYFAVSSSDSQYIAYLDIDDETDTASIQFEPENLDSGSYSVYYLAKPTDIASGTNATLPEFTHNAIVEYAIAFMLQKDRRNEEAQLTYQNYMAMLQNIVRI